ncbi:MAG: hypothetical protein ACRDBO_21040 [Lachnospiraceae bacterium]
MVVIHAPLRVEEFRKAAEEEGLVFVRKVGLKMEFENPLGNDKEMAEVLKKKCKEKKELAAIYFQIST